MNRFTLCLVGAVAIGGGAGRWFFEGPTGSVARAAAPADNLCAGASTPAVAVSLVPAEVDRGGLVLALALAAGEDVRVRWVFELVDDVGMVVAPARRSDVVTLATHASHDARWEVPSGLADGYYQARATVVARAGAHDEQPQTASVYFATVRGEILPMAGDDWHAASRANLAVIR